MFLKKLDYLIQQKGINKNILANESGIPYTTIDGFYKKGYENTKLSTLMKLCAYFNVSLDYLAKDDTKITPPDDSVQPADEFTSHERKIITAYRAKPPDAKKIIDAALGIESEQFSFEDEIKKTEESGIIEAMLNRRNNTKS